MTPRARLLISALALGLGLLAGRLASAAEAPAAPLDTIATLDLPRYMGRWHELARYPNRFQRQCTGATTADYQLLPEGGVQVINRCGLADGRTDEAIGLARPVGPAGTARLQVRFAPAWLGWLPQVWGDYWVVDLDGDYQLSIVSEPRREFLWVLSRTPAVDAATWQRVEATLRQLGFAPERLQRSPAR
ncbi:lipocalin family protein [Ideonella sp. DXS22W]|uniref:Outer membrane lipoprotein Blc n=1 Tax=Pseudaquabacterium inlustre TaxID=2984192 RepID=A0ABU9CC43_9BURK